MAKSRLSHNEIHTIATAYAELEIYTSERSDKPTAVLLLGQEGAGRHALISEVGHHLNQQGGYVSANKETVRQLLPYYDELKRDQGNIDAVTREDVKLLSREIHHQALESKRNLVIEAAQHDTSESLHLAKSLKAAGYHVEVHAAAVNDQISYARAALNYEKQVSSGHPGTYVSAGEHGRNFADASETLRRIEYAGAADRIVVYNRLSDPILDRKPEPGQLTASETFDRARGQLSEYERVNLVETWDAVVESMQKRGAPNAEVDRVTESVERAHYTMRRSEPARESYEFQNPTETNRSRELSENYGAKLAHSFREDRRADAAIRPELVNAFAQMAQAARVAEQAEAQVGQKFLEAYSKRVAAGLEAGTDYKPVVIRDSSEKPKTAELER